MSNPTPLLSIGMIFKNEIRCLERCMKSLQPLRDALPCELVMADTGATDGSREIAEKYADILFDFPWINDFSAARNAVMDRCSGKWYMSIDCDEWLDGEIQGYVRFLTGEYDFDFASVVIRNYNTEDLEGSYSDFLATRLLRMSIGLRYKGAIHEHWFYKGNLRTMMIAGAIFHHDGYVNQNRELIRAKQERNLPLLRKLAEENPEDLVVLNQCVEGSAEMPEQEGYLRRALAGVAEKWSQWELFGPSIYRHAVRMGMRDHLPELEEWIQQADAMFPNSIFLRVEIAYFAFGHYWSADNYEKAISWGERYLQGVADYHAGRFDRASLLASSLDKIDTRSRLSVAVVLAEGYLHEKQPEKCAQLLETLDPCEMEANQIVVYLRNLCRLRGEFGWDTNERMLRFWTRLGEPVPNQEKSKQRQTAFIQAGSAMFTRECRESEAARQPFCAYSHTAFLPLKDVCPLGAAAAIMEESVPEKIGAILAEVDDWTRFPIHALCYALEQGVRFPLPDKPLNVEEMDSLSGRLAGDPERFFPLALQIAKDTNPENWQSLCWARGLLLAAVQAFPWAAEKPKTETGLDLVRTFARVEKDFLPRCYMPDVLTEKQLFLLPPLHRFGWYCSQAFDALHAGDSAGYVRLLREGLTRCEGMKPLVEFLIDHTPEIQAPKPSDELLELAEKVRVILSAYPVDDPAVAALKQSPAYQQVAYLIEGPKAPGGLPQ